MASTSKEKGTDLEEAKAVFEGTQAFDNLETVTTVRRRKRNQIFQSEDFLFVLEFKPLADGENMVLMACLLSIYHALLQLVRKWKPILMIRKEDTAFSAALLMEWRQASTLDHKICITSQKKI